MKKLEKKSVGQLPAPLVEVACHAAPGRAVPCLARPAWLLPCSALPCMQVILEAGQVPATLQHLASVVHEDILQPLQAATHESEAHLHTMRQQVRV